MNINPFSWFRSKPATDKTSSLREAPDLPPRRGSLYLSGAYSFPSFPDPIVTLDARAYENIRRTDVVAQPVNKLARKVGMFHLVAVGKGKRRDAIQNICNHVRGLGDILEFMTWAIVEGVRFSWVKGYWTGTFYAPDLRGCGRLKKNAGGAYSWNGFDYSESGEGDVVKVEESYMSYGESEQAKRQAKTLDRSRVIVFRPGAGHNPEGDLDIGYQLFLVAEAARELDHAQRTYTDRHALPKQVIRKMMDRLRPDEVDNVLATAADRMRVANARQVMAMSSGDLLEYLEPKGTTFDFLLQYRRQLEERASKIVTDEFITTMGSQSPSQSSKSGEDLFNVAAFTVARKLSESVSDTLLPLMERWNPHYLPAYEAGEPPIYLELRPISARTKLSVGEMVQVMDREYPLPTDWICENLGCERDPSLPDFFVGKKPSGFDSFGKNPSQVPPTTEQGGQGRADRHGEESGAQPPRNPAEDARNLPKP